MTKLKCILLSASIFYLHFFVEAQTIARLVPKQGLFVTSNKLNWITGSEINFLTPIKKNHHYYFTWWDQDIDSTIQEKEVLIIGSQNTAVYGTYSLAKKNKTIKTFFDCNWNLPENAVADIVFAKIWLPYLKEASWGDNKNKDLNSLSGFNDSVLTITTPFGTFKFQSSQKFNVKINAQLNPQEKDFTQRSQYVILYKNDIPVNELSGLHTSFFIEELETPFIAGNAAMAKTIELATTNTSWDAFTEQQLLLPTPKEEIREKAFYEIPIIQPKWVSKIVQQYRNILQLQWQIGNNYYPNIVAIKNEQLAEEGYRLEVELNKINLYYKTEQGLQHAVQTLAQITQNVHEQLVIPKGIIKDEPSVAWRGIHMFTGPNSWKLHQTMYNRVLFPLKMNKTVLQCEQAAWVSRPELHNAISVPMQHLKAEFNYLRKHNCEPIPLIQSLGHMEWFFKPKQNRYMAVNPMYPYTLNPNIPQAQEAVKQLWDETFALLKPKTMHIGFDEIGMIGFNEPREKELEYFKTQINFLNSYAKQKKATLMLWGDMGLAPGEGPDALNGITKKRAALIRSYIPTGSYVADWHYLNNPNPDVYIKNLQIWKTNKNKPIASPWLWPNNVRGFVHAAIKENAGVLQTTWADFESSEKNMLQNIEQFGAYILALDYAWSGRKELPENLPYNATEEWIKRLYSQPKPINKRKGWQLQESLVFEDITSEATINLYNSFEFAFNSILSSGIKVNASTTNILPEGTPVAIIYFFNNKQLVYKKIIHYGVEVRSNKDERCIYAFTPGKNNKTLFHFFPKQYTITNIGVKSLHNGSGLTINNIELIN